MKKRKENDLPRVDCATHGKDSHIITVRAEVIIGIYCFMCYNDFLGKNLVNHKESQVTTGVGKKQTHCDP